MTPRRPPAGQSKRWMIPTIALFVGLPVLGLVLPRVWPSGDDELLLPDRTPASYDIVYEVSTPADTFTEEVRVRRPFDGRVDTRDANGERANRVSSLTALASRTPGTGWVGFVTGPVIATADLRFRAVIGTAVDDGRVEARGRRTIAGRTCQVFRAGSSVLAGVITPYVSTSTTYADVCVDRDGLLLEEDWHIDGKPAQRRTATSVHTDVDFDDALFQPDDLRPLDPAQGGGVVRRVDPASGPEGDYLALPSAPRGFTYVGRFAVSQTQGVTDPRVTGSVGPTGASVDDVWTKGADVVVVEQGATTAPLPPLAAPRTIDLGALGEAQGDIDLRSSEVRFSRPAGDYVRVYGTLSVERLASIARDLEPTTGTGLRFI